MSVHDIVERVDELEGENRLLRLQLELADEALDIVLKRYEELMSDVQGLVSLYVVGIMTASETVHSVANRVAVEQRECDYHSKELDKNNDSGYTESSYMPSEYEYGIGISAKRGEVETTR